MAKNSGQHSKTSTPSGRDERLKAALKANLKRRKDQARARKSRTPEDHEAEREPEE